MAALIEAIEIKRKMFFEYEGAPYHTIDVEVSRPTARGGQTLVRIKMRNLITRAVFDKTFKAGEKFGEPDLELVDAMFQYADSAGYHFMHPKTGDTYYFGEDVDTYKNGRVVSHEGAWRHGSNNAHFGLMMPGAPTVGMRFYQELAPRVAMDRAEIVGMNETLATPAGTFTKCLKTRESTPLEPGSEYKIYAPGVGLVQDSTLKLVSRTTTAR